MHSILTALRISRFPVEHGSLSLGGRGLFARTAARLILLLMACGTVLSQESRQVLSHHVRPAVANGQAALLGALPSDQVLPLSIMLPLRNGAGLTALLTRLYDPSSPDFRHFLTVEQFTEQFSPSADDFAAVVAYAQANGLTVTDTPANRLVVPVMGSVAQIDRAFGVSLNVYQHPTENRTFFSPDREPSLDLAVPIAHISGLNNFSQPRPMVTRPQTPQPALNITGSGPGGSYLASDMRAAYYGGTTLTGNGQTLGLLEFTGYDLSDVNSTFTNAGQSYTVPIQNVLLDGATGTGTAYTGEDEVVLDIVQAIGMAPGLSQVRVYIGQGQDDTNILNTMASENIAKVLSCSWSWTPEDPTADDPIFQEFAVQGQSFLAASGDYGAFDSAVDPYFYPQEDAYVTAVGGTHLVTNGAGGSWNGETAWHSNGVGSGGGISPDNIALPSWQTGLANAANGGSTSLRNVPDVAMEADEDNYVCAGGSCYGDFAGTSFAAPRWAGFLALVNEQAVEAGTAPGGGIGFVNPALYRLAQGANAGSDFHDITVGNNDTANQPTWFNAVSGYDLVTGWGSASGQSLIDDLAGPQVPGFWLQPSSPTLALDLGASASTTLTITEAGGFTGDVTLVLSTALPTGVTALWSANPTHGSSVLTLTAANSAPPSTTALTITGTSGSLSATTNITVAVHAPTFGISVSPEPVALNQGSSAATTIQVTPEYGFSGNVTLAVSGLPSGVTASLATNPTSGTSLLMLTASSSAMPGTTPVTITGTAGSLTVTHTLSLSVHGPSFTLYNNGNVDVGQGGSGSTYVLVNSLYGFNGSVNLAVSGLPAGVAASFSPNPTAGTSLLTLTVSNSAPVGTSTLTVTGTSGSLSASTTLTLGVHTPSFTLSNPNTLNIGQGSSGTSYLYVSPQYGFTGSVTLSIAGLPAGVTALWNPNPTSGNSQLSLSASSSAPVGQYTLTITGTSGSIAATTTLTLGVYVPTFTIYGGGLVSVGQGSSVSGSVQVSPEYGFTGTVNLAATGLPSGVTASFSPNPTTGFSNITFSATGAAPVGQYTVTITGSSGGQTKTTSLTLGVYVPTFTLSSYGSPNIGQGTSTTTYVSVYPQYGFTGSVNLSVSGLPSGVTAAFSPNPTTGSSTLTLTASNTASLGQYTLTVTGVSGSQTATTTLTLGVYVPSFNLSGAGSVSVGQGSSGTAYFYVNPQYGFNGAVNLAVSGLPPGVTAAFSPNPTTGYTTLTVTASNTASLGQYTATVTGTSGSQTASTTLTVGVYAPTFSLSGSSFLNLGQGSSGTAYVYAYGSYGFTGSINLAVSGLPSGVTASFSPNPTTGNSSLILTANSTAALGQYTLTITGTSGSLTAATTLTLGVYAPSFGLYSYNNSFSVNQGASGTTTLYLNPQYGFSGTVTLAASGLPSGVTATFAPNPLTYSSTMTLTASSTATPGPATVTITGTSGSLTSGTTLALTVNASTFGLGLAPATANLVPGGSAASTITVVPQNGFSGSVSLAVSGLPAGVTGAFSASATTGTSTLQLTASASAAPAVATATITGTSGSLSISAPLSVVVRAAVPATSTQLAITAAGSPVTSITAGTVVTLTATVSAGNTAITIGQVNFCEASTSTCDQVHLIGTAQLTSAGAAVIHLIPGAGTHSYRAVFVGTTTEGASSSTVASLGVSSALATTTTLAQTGTPGNYALTASVTGQGLVAPTGAVSFLDTSNNSASLGSATLVLGQATLSFANSQLTSVGSGAASMAVADLNGDGKLDLAVGSGNANSLTILLGNGDGTFAAGGQTLATGNQPYVILAADFNADGKPDLAVLNEGNSSVSIFLGNGDGTFVPSALSPQTGSFPKAMAAGDFNGDGLLDLAIANQGSSSMTILLGNGDGTFTAAALSPQTGSSPGAVVVGDFNSDGVLDLAVANGNSNTVSLLLGNGDGTFSAGVTAAAGSGPGVLVAADFNGDGFLDLAVTNPYSSVVAILLGKGDGTFTAAASTPFLPYYPSAMAVADLNGDGVADLAVSSVGANKLTVLLGKGDGTFTMGVSLSTGASPGVVGAGDFTGDGVTDLVAANSFDSTLTEFTAQRTQTATATATGIAPTGSGPHATEAVYAGDSTYATSTSGTVPLSAPPTTPTLTVTPSALSLTTAQVLTVRVTVGGNRSVAPTGSVTLSGGGYTSAATVLINGAATLTVPAGALAAGTDVLSVTFTPDTPGASNYNSATGASTVTVTPQLKVTPVVGVTASATSITAAQALTVTVNVGTGGNGAVPTGSVVLAGGGYTSAASTLGNGTVVLVIPAGSLALGTDALTASFTPDAPGSAAFNPGAGSSSVVVVAAPKLTPNVAVTPSSVSITTAQSLTVLVTVAGANGSPAPTGSVTLTGGGYTTAPTVLSSGSATLTLPAGSLAIGTDRLTVSFTPDAASSPNYNGVSGSASVTVAAPAKIAPSVGLAPSSSNVTTAQPLTVAVTVAGGGGNPTPTGSVTLSVGSYSNQQSLAAGTASFSIPAGVLPAGTDALKVTYTPDASGAATYASASGSVTITVTPATGSAAATVTASVAPAAITDRQSATVTVSVAGSGNQPAPTGTVTLTGGSYTAGQTLANGSASFTVAPGALGGGANTLTASYSGDVTYAGGSGTTTISVVPVVLSASNPGAVSAGSATSVTVTFATGSTYAGTLDVSCALTASPAGAQSLPTCSITPASLQLSGGGSGAVTLTVSTTASSAARSEPSPQGRSMPFGLGSSALAGVLFLCIPGKARRRWPILFPLLLLGLLVAGVTGCAGSPGPSSPPRPTSPGTTAGQYTFTVTGADTANSKITASAPVTITVQ